MFDFIFVLFVFMVGFAAGVAASAFFKKPEISPISPEEFREELRDAREFSWRVGHEEGFEAGWKAAMAVSHPEHASSPEA
jgi:DNA-binding IclR family transcriptional regulator